VRLAVAEDGHRVTAIPQCGRNGGAGRRLLELTIQRLAWFSEDSLHDIAPLPTGIVTAQRRNPRDSSSMNRGRPSAGKKGPALRLSRGVSSRHQRPGKPGSTGWPGVERARRRRRSSGASARPPRGVVGTNTQLAESLTRLGVSHTFEVYDGDHGNRIRERFESQVLRFFSQHLGAR